MTDEPCLDDLTRDAYAHFGLAYFYCEALFQGLLQVVTTNGFGVTTGSIEERTAQFHVATMGKLLEAAKEALPVASHVLFDLGVQRRNFLAHGFWYVRAHEMRTEAGLLGLIEDLKEDQVLFRQLGALTDEIVIPRLAAEGMTLEQWEAQLAEAETTPPPPLASRPTLKRGAQIELRRVWTVPAGGFVFEDATGEIWQLGEGGLCWYLGPLDQDWPAPKWSGLLPATVVGKPKDALPWSYALKFSTGLELIATLEGVKPTLNIFPKGRPKG